jgi:hypothetical protein
MSALFLGTSFVVLVSKEVPVREWAKLLAQIPAPGGDQ